MLKPSDILSLMFTLLMSTPEMLRRSRQSWKAARHPQSWSNPPLRIRSQFRITVVPLKLLSISRRSSAVGNVVLSRMPQPGEMSVKRQSSIRLFAPP